MIAVWTNTRYPRIEPRLIREILWEVYCHDYLLVRVLFINIDAVRVFDGKNYIGVCVISSMGICEQIHDRLPDKNFVRDLDAVHGWNPSSFRKMAVEFAERLSFENFKEAYSF